MRIAAALLATFSLTAAASAADLVVEEAPVFSAPVALWDGAYLGIHAGGAGGTETDNQSELFEGVIVSGDSFDLSGWLLGVHAGANIQLDSFVFGLEGVVDVTNIEGSANYHYSEGQVDYIGTLSFRNTWQASLNVRAGVAVDALLLYSSVGVAIADGTLTDNVDEPIDDTWEDSTTHVGWTVAAGVEYQFDSNWIGRLEARYSDYGNSDYDMGWDDPVEVSFNHAALTAGISYKF